MEIRYPVITGLIENKTTPESQKEIILLSSARVELQNIDRNSVYCDMCKK